MRIVFAGTPEPAAECLRQLAESDHEIVAVLTRPDARRGRGRTLYPSAVKELAQSLGIEVLEPTSLRADTTDGQEVRRRLAELAPECIPVVAYGMLIPPELLTVAEHGWINLHFSLLPAYRGAAPVQAAIRDGLSETGMTVFRIDEGLDTGPILSTETVSIASDETAGELLARMSAAGGSLLDRTLRELASGQITPAPQQGEPSYAAKILPADAHLDFTNDARSLVCQIRALTPVPGAWALRDETRMKIGAAHEYEGQSAAGLLPGELRVLDGNLVVGTGTKPLQVTRIQPPGKQMMDADAYVRGARDIEGVVLR